MLMFGKRFALAASIGAMMVISGCEKVAAPPATPDPTAPAASSAEKKGEDHGHPHSGHGAGPHEGTLADWGGGKYHVEFTVDHDKKQATVYVLGSDEKSAAPIKAKDGEILLTINEPSFQVTLKAAPQKDDPEGTASAFVGTDDKLGVVQEFAGSLSGEIEGTPYAGDFKEEPHGANQSGHGHPHEKKGDHEHDEKGEHKKKE